MKSVIRRIIDYIFPPRCVACRNLIEPGGELCDTCREAYDAAQERNCPLCLHPYRECKCVNRYMEQNGIKSLVKLYGYHANAGDKPENKIIYRLKATTDINVDNFAAKELAPLIRAILDPKREYVIVGVPRSKRAIRHYGGDHIKLLCRALSREMDIPYVHAVNRIGNSAPQKTQRRRERLLSAAQSYRPNRKISLKGKSVILVDDVVTTGASMVACAKILRRMGARKIVGAVLGSAFRYHDLIGDAIYYAERKKKYGI